VAIKPSVAELLAARALGCVSTSLLDRLSTVGSLSWFVISENPPAKLVDHERRRTYRGFQPLLGVVNGRNRQAS
jgi:hypothetical protein